MRTKTETARVYHVATNTWHTHRLTFVWDVSVAANGKRVGCWVRTANECID